MSGDRIISIILGATKFWSITFSNPLPIEERIKTLGTIPKSVEKK